MIVFDELKKSDPALRTLVVAMLAGLFVLLAGLWWVQIVSARDYQANLETQSFRTVRIPAVRGKILDRNSIALAENRPAYNISLYLDELRRSVDTAYAAEAARVKSQLQKEQEAQERKLNHKLTKEQKKQFVLSAKER